MATNTDTQLGQLAIARGLVDVPTLMRCVSASSTSQMRLSEVLLAQGHLTGEQLAELQAHLREVDPDTLREEFDYGETLVLRAVTRTDEARAPQTNAATPVAATLAHPPPRARRTQPYTSDDDGELAELNLEREHRYEFLDELGRGGMGQVLLARDLILRRDIALKTLLPGASKVDQDRRRRLVEEAQVTGILEHPSIIPIYDLGALTSGEPYYTMRVVRERSLEQIIRQMAAGEEDSYSLTQLVSILRQVCLAVHYAHDRGVVHRDLKPENILIGSYGEVFVIDWGVARVFNDELGAVSLSNMAAEEAGTLVGTPQYMAPEQAQGHNDAVDQRTDVYALGAILYEALTLTPVFRAEHMLSLLFKAVEEDPEPPHQRAPDRAIPRELEEICLRALAKDPDDRYSTASAMADDLELFLEGVKERERRRQLALEAVERADEARLNYERTQRTYAQLLREVGHQKMTMTSWAPQEEKERLWGLEQHVEDLQVELEQHFSEATRLYGQALSSQPGMSEARKALADLYWQRFRDAEASGERARATYFEGLVREHNDGWYDQLLEGKARLSITTTPPNAHLTLYEVVEINRRLVERRVRELGRTPLRELQLDHGNYVLEIERDGYVPLQVPLKLDRMDQRSLDLRLHALDDLPDDFVVISQGTFLTGELHPQRIEDQRRYLPTFAIMRSPVTYAEYLEFLNDLARDDLDRALGHAPRLEDGESYLPLENGRFVLPVDDAEGDTCELDWPIGMVSYRDATAFAAWRGRRDGHTYRLPSAQEWEKAARGVDGRLYPWGNHFDASFCRMRDSERGKPLPVSVEAYPIDRSPYGVRHMAGNIIEWTCTPTDDDPNRHIMQGASYNSIPLMCRLDWHMDAQVDIPRPFLGFRLAMSLDDEHGAEPTAPA